MLATTLSELVIWFLWEVTLSFILYTTGAMLIAVASLGRIQKPLYWPARFHQQKRLAKHDFYSVYLTGFFFYLILLTLIVWLG